ncbi:MAG: hypothetical protein DCC73_02640 [Proteobacteria bacterium]|nr:MAG: hypothetical protein DCC73_02640 [Pseudomonadota bacterium]
MADQTPRLKLPYIRASQAQKEVTHNAALNLADALIQAVVEDKDLSAPPGSPAEGQVWIVAAAATGAWAGQSGKLAHYIGGAWVFLTPAEGWRAWLRDEALEARYTGSAWVVGEERVVKVMVGGAQVIGAQQSAIADAAGGATVDAEARTALNALLAACRAHGLIAT